MNLIEKLGLEKCKEIVDGAPEWSTHFNLEAETYTKRVKVISIGFVSASYSLACLNYKDDPQVACISDLRTAIADHERTDNCTDIRNHISNNTKVIER